MASLYNIKQDLLDMFDSIESNEGEVTDEQYETLCIKQEELRDKLDAYVKAIKVWSGDKDSCKCEKKRIGDVQKKYENRIERLKKVMLEAVKEFGEQGKTNKYIELPTVRISTKTTSSVVIDEARIELLLKCFRDYIADLVKEGVLCTGKDVDIQGVLDCLNAYAIAETNDDNFDKFTLLDLETIKVSVNTKCSIADLMRDHEDALIELGDDYWNTHIECVSEKADWSSALKASEARQQFITLANLENNESLIIK